MTEVRLEGNFADWQKHARQLLLSQVPPDQIIWREEDEPQTSLFSRENEETLPPSRPREHDHPKPVIKVSAPFISLAKKVAYHRDPLKWPVLYSVLWRITHENDDLLKVQTDGEVIQLLRMRDQVAHDEHHMHAFVRFRKIVRDGNEVYLAWYKPDHKIVRLAAPFFRERFASMRWSILTPDESMHWDGCRLLFTPGVERCPVDSQDETEQLWNLYYKTTFNPARVNLKLMRSHVPVRHWDQMPELAAMASTVSQAGQRVEQMLTTQTGLPGAQQFIPPTRTLSAMHQAVRACHGCELHKYATQAVFGEGPANARIMLVGEQPGEKEDLAGRPFVGPAGEVFDRALRDANLDRALVYVTNVVKHFAFVERGKRRLHRTPRYSEIVACRPWLEAELDQVRPQLLVCLGASAAKALFGSQFRLTEQRGRMLPSKFCEKTLVTYHPSAVLRAESPASGDRLFRLLVEDLRIAADFLQQTL